MSENLRFCRVPAVIIKIQDYILLLNVPFS